MRLTKILLTLAAASMATAPALAATINPASSLSLVPARVGTSTGGKSKIAGITTSGYIVIFGLAAALVAGIVIAADNHDNPASR